MVADLNFTMPGSQFTLHKISAHLYRQFCTVFSPFCLVFLWHIFFFFPGATPSGDDEYLCTSVKVKDLDPKNKLWIVKFSAIVSGNRAHHMILSKCEHPPKMEGEIYDCRHHQMCLDQSKILFAWAKHADPTEVPVDVGFSLDKEDSLVLQVICNSGLYIFQNPLPSSSPILCDYCYYLELNLINFFLGYTNFIIKKKNISLH